MISGIRYLLLDFDGPVCRVFAGFPATEVADLLRMYLRPYRSGSDDWMPDSADPHEILRSSGAFGPAVAADVDAELAKLELRAVQSAEPTPFADTVIKQAKAAGGKLAIVSNNAQSAVLAYLAAKGLLDDIDYVAARASEDPSLMKPDPHLVLQAIDALSADKKCSALVGDQASDIVAAHSAGIRAIGYANKSGKAERFERAGADLVITSMSQLLSRGTPGLNGVIDLGREDG